MEFSSLVFLFRFLPVFLIIYYLVPVRYRNLMLVLGSIFFYGCGDLRYLPLVAASVIINCILVWQMDSYSRETRNRRWILIFLILLNLGALLVFKYTSYPMPLGMSFYTFTVLSYVLDVYMGRARAEKSPVNAAAYLLMFPKLISGPIAEYAEMQPEVRERRYSLRDVEEGIVIFVLGLGFKVVLANHFGMLWHDIRSAGFESISTPLAWIGAVGYSAELFFDFQGYSLMAIGVGRMLGFHLPKNFDHPYRSTTVAEFYRRWHITLGLWFRNYLYIPLGGSRRGLARTCVNTMVVFLCSGLWHGANWTFLVWGGLHGLCQVAEDHMPAPLRKRKSLPLRIVGVPLTFAIFVTTFTIFRTSSLGNAAAYFAGILHNPGHEVFAQYWLLGLTSKLELLLLLLGIALLVLVDVLHECGLHLRAWVNAAPRPVRWAVYEFAIFAFLLMASFYSNTGFLYARF